MSKTLHSEGHIALVKALIQARKSLGVSQTELATRLKCHQSLVARIESGQRRIDVQELIILARALEIDAHNILQETVAAMPPNLRI